MNTQETVQLLKSRFAETIISVDECCRQFTIEVKNEGLRELLTYLKETPGFKVLMDLTGVDYLAPVKGTKVIYFLHNPTNYAQLRIAIFIPRDGTLVSVTDLWEGADWYERELFDLFGVRIEGHPDMKRILMPDDWVGHPLRKDYQLTEESVEFKHGVVPKIPSQIIPHV